MNGSGFARMINPAAFEPDAPPWPDPPKPGSLQDRVNGIRAAVCVGLLIGPWLPLIGALKAYDAVQNWRQIRRSP